MVNLAVITTLTLALTAVGIPVLAQDAEVGEFRNDTVAAVQESGASSQDAANSDRAEDSRDLVYYPGDTERFKPLTRKLAVNTMLDQKEIWTSPFHMQKQDAKWWIGFGAVTAALVATDHRTSTLLENSQSQVSWANGVSNIGTSYTLLPLVAGFYGFGVLRDNPKAREVGVLGAEALLDGLIVSQVLKPIAGRNRPNAERDQGHFFDGGAAFPSGHAIESWALASVLVHEYGHTKTVPIIALGLAGVVSAARFAAQQHYASDIVAGGAMGWFIGTYVYHTHEDHAIHPHSRAALRVLPRLEPSSRTFGVSLIFRN